MGGEKRNWKLETGNSGAEDVKREGVKGMPCPSVCTSGSCGEPPQPHCRDCSHAIFEHRVMIGDNVYRWEYSPQHGPLFSRKGTGECDWTPNARHKVWKVFQAWHDRTFPKVPEIRTVQDLKTAILPAFGTGLWREREERVLRLRLVEGLTLRECAAQFGVTRERIRQIEGKALRKWRQKGGGR